MIAIICPVHQNPHIVLAQINNYASVHGGNAVHIIHPSLDSTEDFSHIPSDPRLECEVLICKESLPTSYMTGIGAAISATRMVKSCGSNISHVYFHSDSDLLVSHGFSETIKKQNIGYISDKIPESWRPYGKMKTDPYFAQFLKGLGIDRTGIRGGRTQGCFFEIGLWMEIINEIEKYFPMDDFIEKNRFWPYEDVLFATLANRITGQDRLPHTILVRTKLVKHTEKGKSPRDIEENMVQIKDILATQKSLSPGQCVGIKRFSTDLEHPSREYLSSTLCRKT